MHQAFLEDLLHSRNCAESWRYNKKGNAVPSASRISQSPRRAKSAENNLSHELINTTERRVRGQECLFTLQERVAIQPECLGEPGQKVTFKLGLAR